mgnify:CR=1 FL=1
MNYFKDCFTEQQIKARYRELCKLHHPDLGGSEEIMKQVNLAYEERLRMEFRKGMSDDDAESFVDLERELAKKIAEIIGLQGVIIELVGRWMWVTGDTFPVRQILKAAQFCFASKKRAWFFHLPQDTCPSRAKKSLEEIKSKYGSRVYSAAPRACLGA